MSSTGVNLCNSSKIIQLRDGLKFVDEVLDTMMNELEDNGKLRPTGPYQQNYTTSYTTIYGMCTQRSPYNHARDLYHHYREYIESHLRESVLPDLQTKLGEGGMELLEEIERHWTKHKGMSKEMKRLFCYLDRYFVKHHSLPTLVEVGIDLFRTEIYNYIREGVTSAVISMINKDRNGIAVVDGRLVESVVDMYEKMGTYEDDFEKPLLDATKSYFEAEMEGWRWTNDRIRNLASNVFMRAAVEKEKARHYLGRETKSKNLKIAETAATEAALSCAVNGLVIQIFSFL